MEVITESGTVPAFAQTEGYWGAYPIKLSESRSLATAEPWLMKRNKGVVLRGG
jgi:hypothetical protein